MTIANVSARKCASNVIVSKGPDVCLTPVGGAVVPRGAVHTIWCVSTAPAELLLGYSAAAREYALAEG